MAITKITSGVIDSGTITSANIEDGTIVNDDINASAAIVNTKLSGVLTNAGIVGISTFTSSGTWTKATREAALGVTIKRVIVEVQGAGGGSGSGDWPYNVGGAGGGGAYAKKLIDVSSISSATITVGIGGAGASNATAGTGGTSSWADGTNTVSCTGGAGGTSSASNVANGHAGLGGTASGGDFQVDGGDGYGGVGNPDAATNYGLQSIGGSSFLGIGGAGWEHSAFSGTNDGRQGKGYGAGATGSHYPGYDNAGVDGTDGIVIVTEIAG